MRFAATLLLLAGAVLGQDKAQEKAPDKSPDKAADKSKGRPIPDPTNLKILKAKTGAEIGQIMRTFTAGLGVQCSYCHVQGNYASDDNPKKGAALKMIELTQVVNAKFADAKMHVTCYTCHRGEAEPKTAPEPKPGQ
jgi:hypothetical protein